MAGSVDTNRLVFPGLSGLYEAISPYSYAIIRCAAGLIVVYHGYMKLLGGMAGPIAHNVLAPLGLPMPLVWAYFLGALEFFGGIMLAIGLFTRPIALMFTIQMAVVLYWHSGNGYFFTSPRGGWEYPLLLVVLYFAIFFRGGGRCAIDRKIGREL
jgi:putative oxidoreductase